MSWRLRAALMALSVIVLSSADGQEAKPKAKVELRWLERKPIKGVTEDKGIPASEAEGDTVYPHKKPALVLTANEVEKAAFKKLDLTRNGLGIQYSVTIHLKEAARKKLAEQVKGKEMQLVTVTVDGRHWGVHRYEIDKDKKFVPEAARAESFRPDVGFFRSEDMATKIVEALK